MQAQIIPILPQIQANGNSNSPGTTKAEPEGVLAGLFNSMMAEGAKQHPTASPTVSSNPTEGSLMADKPEDTPEESLAVLAAAIMQQATQPALADNPLSPLLAQATQLVDHIVSILEGYPGNNTQPNTDIGSLLQELAQVLTELELPQAEEALHLAEEIQARMPIPETTTDNASKLDKLLLFVEQLRRDLCPPENVNDEALPSGKTTDTSLPPAPAAGQAANGQTSGEPTADEHAPGGQQNPPERQITRPAEQTTVQEGPKPTPLEQQTAPEQTAAAPPRFDFSVDQSVTTVRTQTVPAQAPVAPENLFDAMVERINMPLSETPHMEIQLKPDHLGKLTIDLVLTENGLTAKLLAHDEGVRNLLAAQIHRLSDALAEKGIKVENIDVAYAPLADRSFDQAHHQREQGHANQHRPPLALQQTESGPVYEAFYELTPYDSSLGLSSVEYHA